VYHPFTGENDGAMPQSPPARRMANPLQLLQPERG